MQRLGTRWSRSNCRSSSLADEASANTQDDQLVELVFYCLNHCKTFFFSFFKLKLFQSATRHTRPKAFDFDGLLAPCVWFRGEGHVVGLARGGTLAAALLELLVVQFLQTTHERTKPPGAVPSRAADTSLYTDTAERHSRHATVAVTGSSVGNVLLFIIQYCILLQYNTI